MTGIYPLHPVPKNEKNMAMSNTAGTNKTASKEGEIAASSIGGSFSLHGYTTSSGRGSFKLAVDDIIAGLTHIRLWSMLALNDMRIRYHRTIIGPLWILLSFSLFLLAKIAIFSDLSDGDPNEYIVHLTIGFCVWFYLLAAISDGASALVRNRSWILGMKTPYSIFVFATLKIALLNFLICFIPSCIVVSFVTSLHLSGLSLALLGVLLLTYCIFWTSFILALISVFVRDVIPLVNTIMRIMFFLTPILWMPAMVSAQKAALVVWNPFYHMIEVIRAPIISGSIPELSLFAVIGLSLFVQITAIILFGLLRRWVPSYL